MGLFKRKHNNILIIGPCIIKECEDRTNKVLCDDSVEIVSTEFMMVSPNFVHPEQSMMISIITYINK